MHEHDTKTSLVFLPVDGDEPPGRYFQVRSPYYLAAQCNQKTPILVCSRCQVRSEKAKKEASTLITATTSFQRRVLLLLCTSI